MQAQQKWDRTTERGPVAPLPSELAAAAAHDREPVEAKRAEILKVVREIEQRKREARRAGDEEQLKQLNALSRRFQAAMRQAGSLDGFPR